MASTYDLVGRHAGVTGFPEPRQISVDGATVTNTSSDTSATVAYADRYEDLIAGVSDGTIAPGASVTLDGDYWFSVLVQSSSALGDPVRATVHVGSPPLVETSSPTVLTIDSRDSAGNPTSVTEGGITTTYTWNSDGTPATETRLGVTRTFTYSAGILTGATVS